MNALVTGATGFVGSKHVVNLIKDGANIRLLSREKVAGFETVICDLESGQIPARALEGIDVVFHLAGFAHDIRSGKQTEHIYWKVNVKATIKLAKLAAQSNVKKFIFVSSVKAGGLPGFGQCAGEMSQNIPDGIYGKTKREAELALLKIAEESKMQLSIIRPSLVYGPDVKGNLQLMLSGVKKGWFPPLPEIGNRRSMIHVDDLVRAMSFLADNKHANKEIFIATDGNPYSSREIYNAMCSVAGKSPPKWSIPKILFDLASLTGARIRHKINKLLGDECYSSEKLEAFGFYAKKTLKDMNETDF